LRILKEPLLHFFVLGLAVFGLYALLAERPEDVPDPYLVEVTSADIDWARTMWRKQMGREPTLKEMRGRVHQLIREQVLGREALKLGLDQEDPVLRRRLAQKMDYLIRDLSGMREPSDEDLAAFLQENLEDYEIPARVTFSQVFINADERGEAAAREQAELLIADLSSRSVAPNEIAELGDPLLLEPSYTDMALPDLGLSFGETFAAALQKLPTGSWQGPVRSSFGFHAVYLQDRQEAQIPAVAEVRDRLQSDWMYAEQLDLAARAYQELRKQYTVLVEGLPYEVDVEP
jgi:hypothetical protein